MKIVESPHEAYAHIDHWRRDGLRIGLVPTMGALHEGHLALVRQSRQECDVTAATIFVNPTQFGPHEDYAQYPRTPEADFQALSELDVDLLFVPPQAKLYSEGFSTYIHPPAIAEPLEGVCRPDHFRGVATIVLKLFHILPATVAYFGQKDYQQLAVIRRLVEDLDVPIRVVGCETVREPDGLAMSSRNRYLSPAERQAALSLWAALTTVKELFGAGTDQVAELEKAMEQTLYERGANRIDYARVVDCDSLQTLGRVDRPAVALIAAYVGATRLIDNILLGERGA